MSIKTNKLGKRIQELRKNKKMSQSELADKVGLTYTQIGRYETKGVQPPAEILKRMANALDTSVEYLLSGNTDERAKESLKDAELIRYFKEVEVLPTSEKNIILHMIGAFVRDFKARKTYTMNSNS